MATEIKVPAILIPGIGSYIALTNAIYDETLKQSQSEINASIGQVKGLIEQINGLTGGTVQQASDINVTEIQGLTAKSAQAALEALMGIKADKANAVFHTTLQETIPVVEKLVADIANIAYTDSQGHDLLKLYESVQTLSRGITRLKTRVDQDENNYLCKNLQSDAVIFYGNVEIARLSKEFNNFLNLRSNGKPVWTDVQGNPVKETALGSVKEILFDFQSNYVDLQVRHNNSELDAITELPCASERGAGFMSANDKKALDALPEKDSELLKRIQGISEESDAVKDPFKLLTKTNGTQFANLDELMDILNGMHANTAEGARSIRGVYRAMVNERVISIIVNPLDVSQDVWMQAVVGNFRITDGVLNTGYNDFGIFYRKHENNNWGLWKLSNEDVLKEWIANVDTNITNASTELEKRVQGTSNSSSAWGDAFKKIRDFDSLQALDKYLQGWHGESIEDYDSNNDGIIDVPATKGFIGNFRTNVAGIPIEIFSSVIGYGDKTDKLGDTSVWAQEIKGTVAIDKGAGNHLGADNNRGYVDTAYNTAGHTWYSRAYKQGLRFVSAVDDTGIRILRRIYNGSLGGWGEWVDVTNPYITSPLYGKNVLILGGSFAHNMQAYMNDGNAGFGFKVEGREYAFQNYIAKELGLKRFDNFAVSGNGACIANTAFKYNIYTQLESAIACANANGYKYDAIILAGGINDYQAHSPLGALTDILGDDTFYASYKKIINRARIYNEDIKLFMTTPFKAFHKMECWKSTELTVNESGHRYYEYLQALKDIAQYASIPLLDIWAIQQVDSNNYGRYYRISDGDATHPNGKGYQAVAPAMLEFLAWGKGMETFDHNAMPSKVAKFLDRLMTGLGTDDATEVADRILSIVNPTAESTNIEEV